MENNTIQSDILSHAIDSSSFFIIENEIKDIISLPENYVIVTLTNQATDNIPDRQKFYLIDLDNEQTYSISTDNKVNWNIQIEDKFCMIELDGNKISIESVISNCELIRSYLSSIYNIIDTKKYKTIESIFKLLRKIDFEKILTIDTKHSRFLEKNSDIYNEAYSNFIRNIHELTNSINKGKKVKSLGILSSFISNIQSLIGGIENVNNFNPDDSDIKTQEDLSKKFNNNLVSLIKSITTLNDDVELISYNLLPADNMDLQESVDDIMRKIDIDEIKNEVIAKAGVDLSEEKTVGQVSTFYKDQVSKNILLSRVWIIYSALLLFAFICFSIYYSQDETLDIVDVFKDLGTNQTILYILLIKVSLMLNPLISASLFLSIISFKQYKRYLNLKEIYNQKAVDLDTYIFFKNETSKFPESSQKSFIEDLSKRIFAPHDTGFIKSYKDQYPKTYMEFIHKNISEIDK